MCPGTWQQPPGRTANTWAVRPRSEGGVQRRGSGGHFTAVEETKGAKLLKTTDIFKKKKCSAERERYQPKF